MTDLKEAFRESARREFAMVPDESELDYTFSSGFQRKMQRIIRAQVHGYWNIVNTLGKRIAIAAAIIVMLLTTAMAIKPVRERVIKFFVEVYAEYFAVTFGKDASGDLYATPETMTKYTLSWLPKEYNTVECVEYDLLISTTWKNNDGKYIMLNQDSGVQQITLDHTSEDFTEISHGNLKIKLQTQDGTHVLIWEENNYIFYLTTPDTITIDDALHMIDSLKLEK